MQNRANRITEAEPDVGVGDIFGSGAKSISANGKRFRVERVESRRWRESIRPSDGPCQTKLALVLDRWQFACSAIKSACYDSWANDLASDAYIAKKTGTGPFDLQLAFYVLKCWPSFADIHRLESLSL